MGGEGGEGAVPAGEGGGAVIENPIHDPMWSTRNQASGEARKEVCERMQEQSRRRPYVEELMSWNLRVLVADHADILHGGAEQTTHMGLPFFMAKGQMNVTCHGGHREPHRRYRSTMDGALIAVGILRRVVAVILVSGGCSSRRSMHVSALF
ncbi:hypothetical protein SETIT_5G462900v2 [Setaria italica]|uniref:Uncharacterized protein n=1 Tax=Setaria italica TaxID=4555 RepID=A0A368RG42_SETIT|nr:hypothetical protein SETIT_5G462900v2 [Setaria italica]